MKLNSRLTGAVSKEVLQQTHEIPPDIKTLVSLGLVTLSANGVFASFSLRAISTAECSRVTSEFVFSNSGVTAITNPKNYKYLIPKVGSSNDKNAMITSLCTVLYHRISYCCFLLCSIAIGRDRIYYYTKCEDYMNIEENKKWLLSQKNLCVFYRFRARL